MGGAHALGHHAAAPIVLRLIAHEAERRVEQRDLNVDTLAAALALQQRGKHAAQGVHAGADVDRREARAGIAATRLTHGADHAAEGLQHDVVARRIAQWPVAPVARELTFWDRSKRPDDQGSPAIDPHDRRTSAAPSTPNKVAVDSKGRIKKCRVPCPGGMGEKKV